MPRRSNLPDVIRTLDAAQWSGTAFRNTSRGRSPLSGHGAKIGGGRWNPPGSFPTIYLATSVEACVAEFMRMAEGQARGPSSFLPRDLHVIEVHDAHILDLQNAENLAALGIKPAAITARDRALCHEIALTAHDLKFEAILAPSATGTGEVLAVFEDRIASGKLRHVRTEALETHLPPAK